MLGKWEHCEGYAVSSPPPRSETEFSSAIDSLSLLGSVTSIPLWITRGLWGVVDLKQIPFSGTHWHHGSLVSPPILPPQAEEPFSSGNMTKSRNFPKLLFVTQDEKFFSKGPDSNCFSSVGHGYLILWSKHESSHRKHRLNEPEWVCYHTLLIKSGEGRMWQAEMDQNSWPRSMM